MALIDLWARDRAQLLDKRVHQIIAFAGAGKLSDDSVTSQEFREFLKVVPTDTLGTYVRECLEDGFQDSGFVLQDLVNQIGRRLGFTVSDGRYRGKQGLSGHDGLWRLTDEHTILVEVKTTDAYRIDLNTLAGYRKTLIASATVHAEKSSTLIVVGRQDTGDLEAQIRGSRHAWDIRLISPDALLSLLRIKERVEDPQTLRRIHAILVPREFTRLDEIVDIVFSTAEDAKIEELEPEDAPDAPEIAERSGPKFTPVSFHQACAARLENHFATTLVRASKSTYSTADNAIRLTCSISKRHDFAGEEAFWFAFHPYYLEFLKEGTRAFAAFGCGSADQLFVIPLPTFEPWLEGSYMTRTEDSFYWHVQIFRDGAKWFLKRKQQVGNIEITSFLIAPSRAGTVIGG